VIIKSIYSIGFVDIRRIN